MGVPKFFRYMSERYPCLSELVKEYQIPEFDNLYLDMNGIIHVCSHPNDFDPHFRITEERIFKDIFHYLEILFQMIKPRKLFFMAIDGVAPRAKMNQQRGRRFRSAKEAEVLEKRAEAKGEKLPTDARFDSNCITPGTVFMAKLHEQLKYFVTMKISSDAKWKGVKVILSGHETPGEGEHKIMEYIRWMKSQPDYDHNTRHCLYGLDADLIMLGLCTHEPHFSLLREEVKFGKQSKRISSPEETKFYLLHLSLLREYLDLEFQALKNNLKFPYDLEAIIDDWVLMGFLVGNDFIPHLPDVHIASGALPMLYNAYIEVLPTLEGYINEKGYLRFDRFQKFLEKLAAFDVNQFKEGYADMKYFESKTNRKMGSKDNHQAVNGEDSSTEERTGISELDALIKATNEMVLEKYFEDEEGESQTVQDEDDVDIFASRVYGDDSDEEISDTFRWEFHQHKKDYYRNKLEYGKVTERVLQDQAEGYVRAIQWNLHYYYHGVASWSWYYPHHYAPYVSDICNFKDVLIKFDLGKPFKPFEQLLAVLPAASKSLLPAPYRELMTQESSPILDYYPPEFQTDLNGKKQDWEAVVLIPFIDEQRLLNAMIPCQEKLTEEEKNRNKFGPMLEYCFSEEVLGEWKAPDYFPTVKNNCAKVNEIWRDDLRLDHKDIVHGLLPGIQLDVYFPGFPTFKHLPYSGELRMAKVQVFDQASRGDNMVLTLLNVKERSCYTLKEAADQYLGKNVYCGWPHLSEAKVIGVADGSKRYNLLSNGKVALENLSNILASQCEATKKAVVNEYMRRLGVDIGETNLIVYVNHVAGRKYVFGQAGKITLEKIYSDIQDPYAIQTIVDDIAVHDPAFVQYKTLEQVYSPGSKCFLLASPVYGSMGEVLEVRKQPEARLFIKISTNGEPDVDYVRHNQHSLKPQYMPGSKAAQHVGISSHMLSRITGTVFLVVGNKQAENPSKINIGLNLKFNKRNEEVPGFTKKENNVWLYSRKSIALIRDYIENFPEVFEHLARQTSDDVYNDSDVYPGEDCAEKVSKLAKWLKEIPSAGVDRQSCGAEILDEEVVAQIQDVVKAFLENPPESKRLKLQVKPHVMYKSELRFGNLAPDPSTTYELFDRVVNVRSDSTVPLGLKGTIIGISRATNPADTMFDVLFDQEFPSALSLGGIKGSSYRMSRISFINISHGLRQGLINDSYRNTHHYANKTSPAKMRSEQVKEGTLQGGKWKPAVNLKKPSAEKSHCKNAVDKPYKSQHFRFPAPPDVQLLPRDVPPAGPSNEHMLWNQLQMVSGKSVQNNPLPFPPPPSVLPIPDESMKSSADTKTNALKMMLGVAPVSPPKPETTNTFSPNSAPSAQMKVERSKQVCEITPNAHDVCGFLLQIFQRKGVGVPTYNVALVGSDYLCQLTLPDGTVVTGKEAPTKQMAAENAAMAALHLLKVSNVCDSHENSISGHPMPPQVSTGEPLVGQPQQFFEQFRKNSFPPPPHPLIPSGNPGWSQPSSSRRTLIRASFPQAPPPFPQAPPSFSQPLQHPPKYQQHQQLPPNHFGHYSQPPNYQHRSPQKNQQQRQFNYHRREDFDGNRQHMRQAPQQLHKQEYQKHSPKDSNSFVPLQALKKQRGGKKSVSQQQSENKVASGQIKSQEVQKSPNEKVGKAQSSNTPRGNYPGKTCSDVSSGGNTPSENAKDDSKNETLNSRTISRMRKSRLAINFKPSPSDS